MIVEDKSRQMRETRIKEDEIREQNKKANEFWKMFNI